MSLIQSSRSSLMLLFFILSLAHTYDMKKSDKLHDEIENELKSHHYKNDKIDWIEYFDVSKCELVSKCKPCSFKELQSWPEC